MAGRVPQLLPQANHLRLFFILKYSRLLIGWGGTSSVARYSPLRIQKMRSGQPGPLEPFDLKAPLNGGYRGSMFRSKHRPSTASVPEITHRRIISSSKGLSLDVAGRPSLPKIIGSTRPTILRNKKYRFCLFQNIRYTILYV